VSYHDLPSMLNDLKRLPPSAWCDGVYFDVPKDRRRKQAMGTKRLQVNLPLDLQKRFAIQINRYVEALGKEVAWDRMCGLLESVEPDEDADENLPGPPRAEIPTELLGRVR